MKSPLVSVIIPSFNRPQIVQRAIQSVLNQTYKNFELIVVDDGSTEEYDIKLPAWYYKPWAENRGGSAARNFGLTKAHGQYIAYLDDDNELHPEFLHKTVHALHKNNADAVQTYRKIVYDHGEQIAEPTQTKYPAIDWGWLIKREVFDEIKYY